VFSLATASAVCANSAAAFGASGWSSSAAKAASPASAHPRYDNVYACEPQVKYYHIAAIGIPAGAEAVKLARAPRTIATATSKRSLCRGALPALPQAVSRGGKTIRPTSAQSGSVPTAAFARAPYMVSDPLWTLTVLPSKRGCTRRRGEPLQHAAAGPGQAQLGFTQADFARLNDGRRDRLHRRHLTCAHRHRGQRTAHAGQRPLSQQVW